VNTVKTMAPEEQSLLRLQLIAAGGVEDVRLPAGASFLIKGADSVVTGYRSGKVLFQGRGSDAPVALADEIMGGSGLREQGMLFPVVGGDESGKGDLFGPLVVAAFAARTASERAAVTRAGARDCKLMSDNEVRTVARRLKDLGMSSARVLMPTEYNARYAQVHNVNILLGQVYSELLLELATTCCARTVILDKYGGRATSLWNKPPSFRFILETHAERYPEVAAASVLARAAFLIGLERTAEASGTSRLPKGSSMEAQAFMRRLVADKGKNILESVAKMHFAPTRDCLNNLF
jgi:ribonuclease HIII